MLNTIKPAPDYSLASINGKRLAISARSFFDENLWQRRKSGEEAGQDAAQIPAHTPSAEPFQHLVKGLKVIGQHRDPLTDEGDLFHNLDAFAAETFRCLGPFEDGYVADV